MYVEWCVTSAFYIPPLPGRTLGERTRTAAFSRCRGSNRTHLKLTSQEDHAIEGNLRRKMGGHAVDIVRRAHGVDVDRHNVEAGEPRRNRKPSRAVKPPQVGVQTPGATEGSNESMSQER